MLRSLLDVNRIPQGTPIACKSNLHDVTLLQFHTCAKAESTRAVKMNMHIAGPPMLRILEMVMFHIGQ